MRRECEIIAVGDEGGPETAAIVVFDEGKIAVNPEPGREELARQLGEQEFWIEGGERSVTASSDPEAWFEALPSNFTGSRLRARLVN